MERGEKVGMGGEEESGEEIKWGGVPFPGLSWCSEARTTGGRTIREAVAPGVAAAEKVGAGLRLCARTHDPGGEGEE